MAPCLKPRAAARNGAFESRAKYDSGGGMTAEALTAPPMPGVAAVIDTSLVDGQPKVNRIVVAVDHGFSVNPDSVIAQIQGAALFALTAALKGEITIKDGRVEQSNFHDYPAIMLAEVDRKSTRLNSSH